MRRRCVVLAALPGLALLGAAPVPGTPRYDVIIPPRHGPNHERLRPEENYSSFKGISETLAIDAAAGG